MRKSIQLFILMTMVVGLVACGGSSGGSNNATDDTTPEAQLPTPTPTPEPQGTATVRFYNSTVCGGQNDIATLIISTIRLTSNTGSWSGTATAACGTFDATVTSSGGCPAFDFSDIPITCDALNSFTLIVKNGGLFLTW